MARPRPLDPVPSGRPARSGRRPAPAGRGSCPAPGRWTCIAGPVGVRTMVSRTVVTGGATSRALATRLSSTWARRSGVARPRPSPAAATTRPTSRSSATGSHDVRRSLEDRSRRRPRTRSPCAAARSARAKASRPSTSRDRRSASSSAAPRSAASSGRRGAGLQVLEPQPQRGQRRAQLVGGVGDERLLGADSSLETPARVVERRGQRRAPPAGRRSSGARAARSPGAERRGGCLAARRSGRVTERASATPTSAAATSDTTADAARVSQTRRTRCVDRRRSG